MAVWFPPLSDRGYLVGFENHSKKEKVCSRQRQSISLLRSLFLSLSLLFFNQPNLFPSLLFLMVMLHGSGLGNCSLSEARSGFCFGSGSGFGSAPSWLHSFVSNVVFHSGLVWPHPSALTSIPTGHVHPFSLLASASRWWHALVFAGNGDSDGASVDDLLSVDKNSSSSLAAEIRWHV